MTSFPNRVVPFARRRAALVVLLTALAAAPATAQTPEGGPDPARVRMRVGPLYLNPTLSLTNLGVDTNVFNEPDDRDPKRDFTLTVTPAADAWLRFGRTWITSNVKEDVVWYRKYSGERSGNTSYTVGWQVPLNRVSLNAEALWLNTRERPGFEIDARSRRKEQGYRGGIEVRALSKTYFGARVERRTVDFDRDATFLGNSLRNELNRTLTSEEGTMRLALTPLTSLTLSVGQEQNRFEFSPSRDSESTTIDGGVQFDPFALIKGSATVGYRNFKPVDPAVPGYRGSTMSASLSYIAGAGSTELTIGLTRDVQYSYDINQPYYLQTGGTFQIAQQIYGPVDAVARVGAQRLDYRSRVDVPTALLDRTDHVRSYGGGLGYHMGRDLRIGFNVDQQTRTSGVAGRRYRALRLGTSVTYGL